MKDKARFSSQKCLIWHFFQAQDIRLCDLIRQKTNFCSVLMCTSIFKVLCQSSFLKLKIKEALYLLAYISYILSENFHQEIGIVHKKCFKVSLWRNRHNDCHSVFKNRAKIYNLPEEMGKWWLRKHDKLNPILTSKCHSFDKAVLKPKCHPFDRCNPAPRKGTGH